MARTLIDNVYLVNEGQVAKGALVIDGEQIAEILRPDKCPSATCHTCIDGRGSYLLPGVIDDHVHFRDPGLTHKADIETESRAAAAGGVTSYMDMPNTLPQTTTLEALTDKQQMAAAKSRVNYSFYFGATNTNAVLFDQLDRQHVCGIKLFMGSSTGNMLVDRTDSLHTIFKEAGMIIVAHCEDQHIIANNTRLFRQFHGDDPDIYFHPQIRSEEACYRSSALAVELAHKTGARLHIAHLTTARELSLLETVLLTEKRVTAEACVAHLWFTDDDYATLGARIKCNPAIKARIDRDSLRQALTNGRIDVIATDHAPHLLREKQGGALGAMSGMPMIQFSLVAMLELSDQGILTLPDVVEKMCHAPAKLFQIRRRGFLRQGYQADLVMVRPHASWTVTNDTILSKCRWSPLEGHTFDWKVERTWVNGCMVYADGQLDDTCRGQALEFER